ncbi:MAG: hypothetical protein DMF78_18625 [Acidobacteria bacterium]|nr:MAG: hypothetical protein DMF78_18625 [Acidobacteriota bacterium]
MSTDVWTNRFELDSVADSALRAAARLWFLTAVVGQLVFVFAVASYYTSAVVRGNFAAVNRFMPHGYVPGDTIGNVTVAVHLFAAVLIILSGAIQLIPQVRHRAPSLHRWNGRLYMVSAFAVSIAGLLMTWVRGTVGDVSQHIGSTLNAVLIMLCAAMALRFAMARDFQTHRRWALRLFLAVGGVWFIRIGLALSFLIFKGPFGFDPTTFRGPFLTFLVFASYLAPLGVLELYLRAQERSRASGRMAMAAGLLALTLAMGVGLFAATMAFWVPRIKAAYDGRKSIAAALSGTIASRGVEEAVKQYHDLKAAAPATYNFDERELNSLGYTLIRGKQLKDAVRIFQLNVQAYPRSSNAYDSLAEAFMDDGDKPQAIANYRKALQLNPNNRGAALSLRKLTGP